MRSSLPGNGLGFEPRPGNVYLVEEKRPKLSYDMFEQALASGFTGMVVTRDFPKRLMADRDLGTSRVVWMTNLVGENRVNPTAIGILMSQVRTFIEGQPKTVLIIDGLEYLISLNTYDRMLQFMHQLRDVVVTNDCILFVPLDPRTVAERELALLERGMEPIQVREVEVQDEPLIHEENGEIRLVDYSHR